MLATGSLLLAAWLGVITLNALGLTTWHFAVLLLESGALLAVGGILYGGLLDYLSLRQTAQQK